MEAKELRIGNWVKISHPDIDKFVYNEMVVIDFVQMVDKKNKYIYDPIPITEEILIKAGFKSIGDEYLFDNDIIYYLNEFSWNMGDISYNGSDDWFKCEYVHDLQNFYFALTGEELELEL